MQKLKDKKEILSLLPLIICLFLVPLIIKLKPIKLVGDYYTYWNGQAISYDFFSFYKMIFILISAVVAIIILGIKLIKKDVKIDKNKVLILLGLFIFLVILSTLFSSHKDVALKGFVDRYEGALVLISYIVLVIFTMAIVKSESQIKVLIWVLISSAIIIGVIGVTQLLGGDIIQTNGVKSFILGADYKDQIDNLKFVTESNTIYSTLYHRDYVGSYMAMLFPLTFVLCILVKNKLHKIILGIISLLMFVNLFGSQSRAGYLGGIVALLVFVIVMHKHIIKKWKQFLAGLIILILIFAIIDKVTDKSISSRLASIGHDIKTMFNSKENSQGGQGEDSVPLKDIKLGENSAEIITSTDTLKIQIDGDNIFFKDNNDELITAEFNQESGEIKLEKDAYEAYQIKVNVINGKLALEINKEYIKLFFAIDEGKLQFVDYKGNDVHLEPIESWGFKGLERIGSSRGYIWSRSIPMLKDNLLIGNGPDTFAINFPQYDFKGKMYAYYGDMWHIVDKPHNFYLQTALNTGVLSLVILLVLFGVYIYSSVKIYMKSSFEDSYSRVGLSILIAVIGYLISVFFNDSIVSVAPVFWILLGIGLGINNKLNANKGGI